MTRVDLDGFYLLLTDMPNRTTCHVASQKGLRVIHVLRRWTGSIYWNGRELDRSGVIVWGDSCDYCRVGSDVQTIALVIDESRLRQQIETWTASSHAFWDALDGQMLADTPAARRFIEGMEWVFALAAHAPERFGSPEIRASLREQLLLALIEAVDAPQDGVLLGNPIGRHRARIVRQMTDCLVAHPDGLMELSRSMRVNGLQRPLHSPRLPDGPGGQPDALPQIASVKSGSKPPATGGAREHLGIRVRSSRRVCASWALRGRIPEAVR